MFLEMKSGIYQLKENMKIYIIFTKKVIGMEESIDHNTICQMCEKSKLRKKQL